MTNKEFKDIIDKLIRPLGFKVKGNFWRLETNEIEKIVHLQKSNFSNLYYINYGYNLKRLDDDDELMHIYNRLSQSDAFDLENNLDSDERISMIREKINNELLLNLNKINSESDILELLKKRTHLNDITLKVKDYLKLN